jgi:hypothetical protein
VLYCTSSHQIEDRPAHRSVCSKIKRAQAFLQKEERTLKRELGENVFKEQEGQFWVLQGTIPYIRARFTLAENMLKVNSELAVTATLHHLLAMLQLCPYDFMGLREVMFALYLRLGRDQDCYDFVKWWNTTGEQADYNWNNFGSRVKNADAFEEVDQNVQHRASLSHMAAITLLKIRLIIDLQTLQRARQYAGPHFPQEILDAILQYTTTSGITRHPNVLDCEDQAPRIRKVKWQVKQMFSLIEISNKHFWPALLAPADNLRARPQLYEYGGIGQMQLALQYNYNAWVETPGAIGVIEELMKR